MNELVELLVVSGQVIFIFNLLFTAEVECKSESVLFIWCRCIIYFRHLFSYFTN